jgi:hypothetical protein
MTTLIPFLPSNIKAPDFLATFDGSSYKVVVTFNISAQRYYINVYDSVNQWIITVPLISTPPGRKIESAVWDQFLGIVTVTLEDPSLWPVPLSHEGIGTKPGTMIDYTLQGFVPDTYNGKFRGLHIDPLTFTIPMTSDPGEVTVMGSAHRFLNMVESVFETSTLIYRNGAFQIDP